MLEKRVRVFATKRFLVGSFIVLSALQLIMFVVLSDLSGGLVELQLAYSREEFGRIIESWTPEQQAAYRRHFRYDFVYPIAYASFLCSSIANLWLRHGLGSSRIPFVFLPWFAAAFDTAENCFHLLLLDSELSGSLVLSGALCATCKWLLLVVSLLTIMALLVRRNQQSRN